MTLRASFLSPAPAPARPVAPHVRAAIGHSAPVPATQAKAAPAPARPVAPHVRAAIGHPAPAPATQTKAAPASVRPVAPHVRAAVGHPAPAAQAKTAGMKPPAAHVAAAVARSSAKPAAQAMPAATVRPPAPHLAAAIQLASAPPPRPAAGVLQPAKQAAWLKRKQGYIDEVGAANQTIHNLDKTQPTYFKLFPDVPADVKVSISGLPSSGPLNLGQTQSQMVNFSYSMKEVSNAAPELQTAIISDKSKKISRVRLSANKKNTNKKLVSLVKDKKLSDVYKHGLRPHHVAKRRKTLEQAAPSLSKTEVRAILNAAKGNPQVKLRKDFDKEVNKQLALKAHKKTRKDEARRRMKSARQLAYVTYPNLPVDVANNDEGIHGESAIYTQTAKNPNEEVTMVFGTKVPCLACQTFFRGKGVSHLMIDHSSFAWLSEPSLKQLGFAKDEIQKYLLHIRATLGGSGINEYSVSSGEIAITDLTVDADPASDSEDEDAREEFDYQKLSTETKKNQEFLMEIETAGKGYK